jgi:hypothetical protein
MVVVLNELVVDLLVLVARLVSYVVVVLNELVVALDAAVELDVS